MKKRTKITLSIACTLALALAIVGVGTKGIVVDPPYALIHILGK